MATTQELRAEVKFFKGLKNDEDQKQVPFEYFFRIKNFNYPARGILGLDQILLPEQISQIGSSSIDALFDYRFLDNNNILRSQKMCVTNGTLYKDVLTTPVSVGTGLTSGLCSCVTFNDKMYIANGKDYVKIYDGAKGIVTEMGAPFVEATTTTGNPNGAYYYAITYVTAAGEGVIGSVSNTVTVSNKKILLTLPQGYLGTLTRKIYRTVAGGTALLYVATISNNTDLTYEDNTLDGNLGAAIPLVTNELPKPYFLIVANQQLIGTVVTKFPTQLFTTGTNNDIFDAATYKDIANYGYDNTPVSGIGTDFGKVLIGTGKNIFIYDPSDGTIILSRANVGIKNGYSVKQVPATADFPGGLMFLSTLNDIRVMSGIQALPVATSLDNVHTQNWSQNIRGSFEDDVKSSTNIYAEFYNYQYHLAVNYVKYVFDIRTNGWTYHDIRSTSYSSQPVVLGVFDNLLYNGQTDGWIEQEYADIQYRGEDVEAFLESAYMDATTLYKFVRDFFFWFLPSRHAQLKLEVSTDQNTAFNLNNSFALGNATYILRSPELVKTFKLNAGVFDSGTYSNTTFLVDNEGLDYRVAHINRKCRWIKYKITVLSGLISYQGFSVVGTTLANKE
jgi:hypothetical protein